MNKNYTLKELADIGAKAANKWLCAQQDDSGCISISETGMYSAQFERDSPAREAFTKAVLDAVGYELPKDEEREAFERWLSEQGDGFHPCGDVDKAFAVWKAGREELRRAQMTTKEPPELVDRPLPAYGEVKTEPAWIPWEGGECPLADTVKRWEYKTRGGQCILTPHMPRSYRWWFSDDKDFNLDDILAYRVWEG